MCNSPSSLDKPKFCFEYKSLRLGSCGSYKTSKQQKDSKLLKTTRFEVLLTKIQNEIRFFTSLRKDKTLYLIKSSRPEN